MCTSNMLLKRSPSEVFCKKDAFKFFAKFTKKQVQSRPFRTKAACL